MNRRGMVRVVASGGVAVAVLAGQQLPAQASTARYDDRQVVQLTTPGAVRGAGGIGIHLTSRDAVEASNAAVASTSCDDCRATAISFSVVVADAAPTSVKAGNVAYAANTGCARCESDAIAYQFVLVYHGDARLSGTGRHRLEQVGGDLRALARSGSSVDQIEKAAEGYADQVADILGAELRVRPEVRRSVHRQQALGPGQAT